MEGRPSLPRREVGGSRGRPRVRVARHLGGGLGGGGGGLGPARWRGSGGSRPGAGHRSCGAHPRATFRPLEARFGVASGSGRLWTRRGPPVAPGRASPQSPGAQTPRPGSADPAPCATRLSPSPATVLRGSTGGVGAGGGRTGRARRGLRGGAFGTHSGGAHRWDHSWVRARPAERPSVERPGACRVGSLCASVGRAELLPAPLSSAPPCLPLFCPSLPPLSRAFASLTPPTLRSPFPPPLRSAQAPVFCPSRTLSARWAGSAA